MSLPTKSDLQSLDYARAGQPFANIEIGTGVSTLGLDYAYAGQPFVSPVAAGGGGGGGGGALNNGFFLFM